ncbi:hypothetical protein N658DRAFT_499833 [Parathielavia hyrcaniae]|uniref:Uncharacterized protein n=1 Tax=Parathielavia hyrcaniae TaxID=113614 RepID=A0AAN6PYU8_9PEZI|nr:hypothetical protein N658DRAFT_499833 [Parathielavia hyrcaniae]
MGRQVLCDLVFHFQGVSERPEIPHHPARQPRLSDTNDKNKLQQTLQDQGDTGYENHPTLSTFCRRDRAPPALPSSGRVKSRVLAAKPTELLIDRGEGR